MYKRYIKRPIDLVIALSLLILLLPVFIIIVGLVYINMGRTVLFKQQRPGLNGKPFTMYKFCTMKEVYDEDGNLLPDQERLTSFGRFFRSTSLDELPELINVIKGEMSLVGPRPLLMSYLDRYTPEQEKRHNVKPGITGWAQVNGRNALSWDEKFKLDVWYVNNQSFWLDVKILWFTIRQVFCRKGITAEGHATMPEFIGNSGKR